MPFMINTKDITSYTDEITSLIAMGKKQWDLETKLQKTSVKFFKWFH